MAASFLFKMKIFIMNLIESIYRLITNTAASNRKFQFVQQVKLMRNLCNTFIEERQFALSLGSGKFLPILPKRCRNDVVPITLGDGQLTTL